LCRQIFCKATSVFAGLVYACKYRISDHARIFRKKVRTHAAAGCPIKQVKAIRAVARVLLELFLLKRALPESIFLPKFGGQQRRFADAFDRRR
jgi:hypothetical protein